jgi:ankyrin repeat protein
MMNDSMSIDIYTHSTSGDSFQLAKSLSSSSISSLHRSTSGTTALHRTCKNVTKAHADCLQLLITHTSVDVNTTDSEGNTSLHEACISNNVDCARILLEANANVNIKNDDGNTSLMLAIINHSTECIRILLNYGADIHTQNNDGLTPSDYATRLGYKECISLLLDKGGLKIKEKDIKYHLPQCREIIKMKRESFDSMVSSINYEAWQNDIYSKCFNGNRNLLIPTIGWPRAFEIYKKYYYKNVLFLTHLHIAKIYSNDETDPVQQLARNSNKTSLLISLMETYIAEYL